MLNIISRRGLFTWIDLGILRRYKLELFALRVFSRGWIVLFVAHVGRFNLIIVVDTDFTKVLEIVYGYFLFDVLF